LFFNEVLQFIAMGITGLILKVVFRGRRGRDHMVVGFTITYAISVYHH
jgi:hypothetical protein